MHTSEVLRDVRKAYSVGRSMMKWTRLSLLNRISKSAMVTINGMTTMENLSGARIANGEGQKPVSARQKRLKTHGSAQKENARKVGEVNA